MKSLLSKAANLVGKLGESAAQQGQPAWPPQHQGSSHVRQNDPVLDHLLQDFRSATLRKHFFAHAAEEYTDTFDIKVLAGTYNVAGKKPPPGLKLHEWLNQWKDCWPVDRSNKSGPAAAAGPDIVVVGFQEVVPLSAGNVIAGPSSDGADAWDFALASTLNGDEWTGRNFGRTFGSSVSSQAMIVNLERLGLQAAYAYNVLSSQAATVVGAMDKMWSGSPNTPTGDGQQQQQGLDSLGAEQQQARLQLALSNDEDGDGVYVQVACKQLVGVYLSLWARKGLARHVRAVQATSAATGFGGYLGNKGAVAIRLRVHDAPLLVVCSHLASGDAEGDELKRNNDVADIMRRCLFSGDTMQQQDLQQTSSIAANWGSLSSIMDHQNVIWLGDLNYRLVCGDEEARRYIKSNRLEALVQHDQLTREMAAGRVFKGWREGPITFNPTYKYHLGCNVYSGEPLPPGVAAVKAVDSNASLADSTSDTAGDGDLPGGREPASVEKQKKRTPAWCDRVLWLLGGQLYQLAYGRGELAVSDHRPVAAAFLLEAHRYQRETVQQLAEAARRAVDMSDNAARPRCTLSPNFVELGLVPFGTPKRFAVKLSNMGSVAARYYFIPPPKPRQSADGHMGWDNSQPLCPPWMQIQPLEGEVDEGSCACIALTALITGGGPSSAAACIATNTPQPPAPVNTLDTILILRLEDGADSFISVHGTCLPSCFGMELDVLLTLGSSPLVAVEQLGEEGQRLLQKGLEQPAVWQQLETITDCLGTLEVGQPAAAAASFNNGNSCSSNSSTAAAGTAPLGVEDRVPKEVQRLVKFLQSQQRLYTPGLFVNSILLCTSSSQDYASLSPYQLQQQLAACCRTPAQLQRLLAATSPVRWALDTGLDFPSHVTAHQAAAALLLMLQQLPSTFMPTEVNAVLMRCIPASPVCLSMLSDAMTAVEWATFRHILSLLKAALAPETVAANRLSVHALATVLAEVCFKGLAGVHNELVANRVAFMMNLLDPEATSSQCQAQQQ